MAAADHIAAIEWKLGLESKIKEVLDRVVQLSTNTTSEHTRIVNELTSKFEVTSTATARTIAEGTAATKRVADAVALLGGEHKSFLVRIHGTVAALANAQVQQPSAAFDQPFKAEAPPAKSPSEVPIAAPTTSFATGCGTTVPGIAAFLDGIESKLRVEAQERLSDSKANAAAFSKLAAVVEGLTSAIAQLVGAVKSAPTLDDPLSPALATIHGKVGECLEHSRLTASSAKTTSGSAATRDAAAIAATEAAKARGATEECLVVLRHVAAAMQLSKGRDEAILERLFQLPLVPAAAAAAPTRPAGPTSPIHHNADSSLPASSGFVPERESRMEARTILSKDAISVVSDLFKEGYWKRIVGTFSPKRTEAALDVLSDEHASRDIASLSRSDLMRQVAMLDLHQKTGEVEASVRGPYHKLCVARNLTLTTLCSELESKTTDAIIKGYIDRIKQKCRDEEDIVPHANQLATFHLCTVVLSALDKGDQRAAQRATMELLNEAAMQIISPQGRQQKAEDDAKARHLLTFAPQCQQVIAQATKEAAFLAPVYFEYFRDRAGAAAAATPRGERESDNCSPCGDNDDDEDTARDPPTSHHPRDTREPADGSSRRPRTAGEKLQGGGTRAQDEGACAVMAACAALRPVAATGCRAPGRSIARAILQACTEGDHGARRRVTQHLERHEGLEFVPGANCARDYLEAIAKLRPEVTPCKVENVPTTHDGEKCGATSLPDAAVAGIFYKGTAKKGHWIAGVRDGEALTIVDNDVSRPARRAPAGFQLAAIVLRLPASVPRDATPPGSTKDAPARSRPPEGTSESAHAAPLATVSAPPSLQRQILDVPPMPCSDACDPMPPSSDPEQPCSRCTATSKKGTCGAPPVPGFDRCAAHLYVDKGTAKCQERSNSTGNPCGQRVALGLTVCPYHVERAAARLGKLPPAPGQPLDTGIPLPQGPARPAKTGARTDGLTPAETRFLLMPVKAELEDPRRQTRPIIKVVASVGQQRCVWFGRALRVVNSADDWFVDVEWLQDELAAIQTASDEPDDPPDPTKVTGLLPPRNGEYCVHAVQLIADTEQPHFQRGQTPTPSLAALKGAFLKELTLRASVEIDQLAERGLSSSVRKQHRRILRQLAGIPLHLQALPLPDALLKHVEMLAITHRWTPGSRLRHMGSMMGALARTDLYTNAQQPIPLSAFSAWSDAMRAARLEANESQPNPPALTWAQTEAAVAQAQREGRGDLAALLLLTFAIAARASDVVQLLRSEIHIDDSSLTVQFRRGKGVAFRGPYTVHGALANESHRRLIQQHLDSGSSRWAWHCTTPQERHVLQADLLRIIRSAGGSHMRQSSIRRGALQHMVACGASEKDMMHFSGHTQVSTLRRYLGWGTLSATAPRTRELAMRHTAPPSGLRA